MEIDINDEKFWNKWLNESLEFTFWKLQMVGRKVT